MKGCTLLFKCNLKDESPELKHFLSKLDLLSDGTATEYYATVDLDKDCEELDSLEDPFFNDISQNQTEEDLDEDELIEGLIAMEEIQDIHKKEMNHSEIESLAQKSLVPILIFIEEAENEGEVIKSLTDYCGPNGILRKCDLSDSSPVLCQILDTLDAKTHSKASKIYYSH